MQCYALIGNVLIDKSYTAYSKVTKLIKEKNLHCKSQLLGTREVLTNGAERLAAK